MASKLRQIASTNQFLDKCRAEYTGVAFRASTLYFAITDLGTINNLYCFSMRWFFNLFKTTLGLTNALKPKKTGQAASTVKVNDEEF